MSFLSVISRALRFLLPFVLASAALAKDPDPVPRMSRGDPAMAAAYAKARAGLDDFLSKWRRPAAGMSGFTVKVGLADAPSGGGFVILRPNAPAVGHAEYFWIVNLRASGDEFEGEIGNDPDVLQNVARDQKLRFVKEDVADWMYRQNGRIVGNATACPALAHAPADERKMVMEKYGLACD